jgi:hypothetical protein
MSSPENPLAGNTDAQLIDGVKMGYMGPVVESMRRLRVAVERQSRASMWLTWAVIGLMVVQIGIAVWRP